MSGIYIKSLDKSTLIKFLIPAFYVSIVVLMVLNAWNIQNTLRQGGLTPLYLNLMEQPVYIKKGFNAEELQAAPADQQDGWALFKSRPLWIKHAPLPDMPKRPFFSPRGRDAEEFTIIIPVEMSRAAISFLDANPAVTPGIFLASIGENWEIFFNGTPVISEMHLSENGAINERRTWRYVSFPIARSLVQQGTNVLAMRIVGDPAYVRTGLRNNTPYFIDDYRIIQKHSINFPHILLCGFFCFTGIYFLVLFLFVRNRRESYYLCFSIFSLLLAAYTITRHCTIYYLIPNSDISMRIEYGSMMLLVPPFGMFIEILQRKRITKVTLGYMVFCLSLALSQIFFCADYGEDAIRVWDITAILYFTYLFFYDVVYFYFFGRRKTDFSSLDAAQTRMRRLHNTFRFVNVFTSVLLIYLCGIYEILDVLFFHNAYSLFIYSTFAVHFGMVFTLSQQQRFRQKKINRLEGELQQQQIAIMLSQIQPHFLYNSLMVIQQLYKIDLKMGEETVAEFSDYLRGNLDSLTLRETIPFEQELHHVVTYLSIEKKRFWEKLNVVYDINKNDFMLPALTLQPIVENAVRYGVTKKDDGGTVTIRTEEVGKNIVITVTDDGVGFFMDNRLQDGRSHVGIENVRNRLALMCDGLLEIQSKLNEGTKVVITIPCSSSYPSSPLSAGKEEDGMEKS